VRTFVVNGESIPERSVRVRCEWLQPRNTYFEFCVFVCTCIWHIAFCFETVVAWCTTAVCFWARHESKRSTFVQNCKSTTTYSDRHGQTANGTCRICHQRWENWTTAAAAAVSNIQHASLATSEAQAAALPRKDRVWTSPSDQEKEHARSFAYNEEIAGRDKFGGDARNRVQKTWPPPELPESQVRGGRYLYWI